MSDELQFAQACADAAKHLRTIADELATNPDDPEAVGKALHDTLAALEQLAGMQPHAHILASLQQTATDLKEAGAITPDKIREIADALDRITQDYTRLDAQGRANWQ
ncbi:hypothetical protein [Mycolicibacterium fortuitum]|uniref:hypothetical protein n=1 Tax=Mycolicibacterium fortuitum TaxID=1766 RepID=UPI003AAA6B36